MDFQKKNIKLLHNFQDIYDVSQIEVNNIKIWPLIVYELNKHNENYSNSFKKNLFKLAIEELKSFFRMQYDSINDRKRNVKNYNNSDILFLTQSTRRLKIGDSFFDRMCDPFVDAFEANGVKCQVIEWSYDHKYKIPRYNKSDFIQLKIILAVLKSFLPKKSLKSDFSLLQTKEFNQILRNHNYTYKQFIKNIEIAVRIISSFKKLFEKNLLKTNAKKAFYYPYYGAVSFAFRLACKSKGIYTIEIQHGFTGERNYLQNGHRNINTNYDLLPDAIWCWEERDKQIFSKWGKISSFLPYVFVGGNLWMNIWLYPEFNGSEIIKQFESTLSKLKTRNSTIILFTLHPFIDIPEWLPDYISSNNKNILWCMRFHHNTPDDFKVKIREKLVIFPNIEFDISNSYPLPALLRICDFHITIESSSVMEAKDFSVRSIIVHENGIALFKELIEENEWVFYAINKEQFDILLKSLSVEKPKKNESYEKIKIKSNLDLIRHFADIVDKKRLNFS